MDRYFVTDVDFVPEEADVRYTRSSWVEVYDLYVKSCLEMDILTRVLCIWVSYSFVI